MARVPTRPLFPALLAAASFLSLARWATRGSTATFVTAGLPRRFSSTSAVARRASRYEAPADLKPPATAQRSGSGLAWQVLEPGTGGKRPNSQAVTVFVEYCGWKSSNGQLFDTTYTSGEPSELKLSEEIPGWIEGLSMMEEGERRRLWIPADLAYGKEEEGKDLGVPLGDLVYDIKLVKVEDPGSNLISFFGGAFVVLILLTFLVSAFSGEPQRREYDTRGPFTLGGGGRETTSL